MADRIGFDAASGLHVDKPPILSEQEVNMLHDGNFYVHVSALLR